MKHWIWTALSFAAVVGVSIYAVATTSEGLNLVIPLEAHALAFTAFCVEVLTRSFKLTWSARAVGTRLNLASSVRTSLGGDFAASITPARVGAEPARFLILSKSGIAPSHAMVILYLELFLEMISLGVIVVAIAMIFDTTSKSFIAMIGVVGGYAAFVLGLGLVGVILASRSVGDDPPAWASRIRLHGKRWAVVQRWFTRVRMTVDAFRTMNYGWATMSLLASITHVAIRFTILPSIVYLSTDAPVQLAPLVIWPLGIIYGAGVVPAPGGGGAVELAFRAAFSRVIPASVFAAALVWWRFYTFYIYIAVGALVAGNIALRAVRQVEKAEEELEKV